MANLKNVRQALGWTQQQMATKMGTSQAYVAMLEKGHRRLTPRLARKLVRLGAPPTVLPLATPEQASLDAQGLAEQLGALGYPGFSYLAKHVRPRNPAEVLLAALAHDELEARLVEGLPWLLAQFWEMDFDWLVREAKQRDLQNRLGFVAMLAREQAARTAKQAPQSVNALRSLEAALEPSRLAREDTLGRRPSSDFGREWLRTNRSNAARHWSLLTTWRAEDLRYA
ncbi:MAG: helix-turn-helix domain-containing protein [Candidatus Acidiferrales bacterium]